MWPLLLGMWTYDLVEDDESLFFVSRDRRYKGTVSSENQTFLKSHPQNSEAAVSTPLLSVPHVLQRVIWLRSFCAFLLYKLTLIVQNGAIMAPIKDQTVDTLRELVHKLESRVEQLEAKLNAANGGESKSEKPAESIRMILMGPPGAGMLNLLQPLVRTSQLSVCVFREGYASTENKREILRLSLGMSNV